MSTFYDMIEALEPGTVFQVSRRGENEFGDPWMRSHVGVMDLIPISIPAETRDMAIPEMWHEPKFDQYEIRILFDARTGE